MSPCVLCGSSDRRSRPTMAQGTDSIRTNNKDRRGLQEKVLVRLMVTAIINRNGGAEDFVFLSTRPNWADDYISGYLGQKQIDFRL